MGGGANPARRKAKPAGARKSQKNDDSNVHDLEKRLAEALKDKAEAQEQHAATAEILRVISNSPADAQPVFDAIAVNALRLCDAEGVVVARYDGALLHVAAHHNVNRETVDRLERQYPQVPSRDVPLGQAVLDGVAVHVPDLQAAVEFAGSVARQLGAGSHVAIPLLYQGRAIGGIGISRRRRGPFSDNQITLLKTFAAQAVIAIENTRLFNETKEALEQQTATSEILRVISSSPTDVQPVFDAITESAARLCGVADGWIVLTEGDTLRGVSAVGQLVGQLPVYNARRVPLTRESVIGRAILDRTTIHIDDLAAASEAEYPEGRALQRMLGHRTQLVTPLLREGVAIGAILLARFEVRLFSERQIELLKTFADQAVIAIENVRLFTELQEKNRALTQAHAQVSEALERQTATSEILGVISRSPTDVQPVFDSLVASAARLCGANDILLLIREGDVLRPAAGVGAFWGSLATDFRVPLVRGSVAARSVIDSTTLHIPDLAVVSEADFSLGRDLQRRFGHRTVLAVPLFREGVALGTIFAMRFEVRPFADQQIALLKTFADQAVIAIENVRLFTELQAKNRALTEALDQQTATSEILRVISSSPTEVQPVFEAIARAATTLCEADLSGVYPFDGNLIHFGAQYGRTPEEVDAAQQAFPQAPSRLSVTARAVMARAPVQVEDVSLDREVADSLRIYRSVLAVPMVRDERSVGAITVARRAVRGFSEEQIALLKTFADQAVIAIENARLFTELQEKNQALTQAHAQVTESLERQTATSEILRVISSSPTDVRPVFSAVAKSAARLCEAQYAGIALVEDGSLVIPDLDDYGVPGEQEQFLKQLGRIPISPDLAVGRAVIEGTVQHIEDVLADGSPRHVAEQIQRALGFRTFLAVPMRREGATIGVIVAWRTEPRPFTTTQIELVKTFADQAVIAIENVRLVTELQEKNRALTQAHAQVTESLEQQTATAEILRVISGSPTDVQPVLDAIAERSVRLCGALFSSVYRFDGELIHMDAHFNYPAAALERSKGFFPTAPHRRLFTARAILEHTSVHVPDVRQDAEFMGQELVEEAGFRAVLSVPMLRNGAPIGAVTVWHAEVGAFTDKHIALLQTFADQAVIAIENVRLFTELEARNAELTTALERQLATSEILRVISGAQQDAQAVFDTIVQSAVRLCRGTTAAVFRVEDGVVYHPANYGGDPEALAAARARYPRPVDIQTMPGMIVLARSVVQIPDSEEVGLPDHVRQVGRILGFRSVVGVPMLREGEAVGALLVTRREPGRFSDPELELLKTFSDQAVIAIENVRLFTELQEKNRALTRAHAQVTEALEQQTATSEILRVISSLPTDVHPVFDAIVRNGMRLTEAARCVLMGFDGEMLSILAMHNVRPEGIDMIQRVFPLRASRHSAMGRAVLDRAIAHIPDVALDPEFEFHEAARAIDFRAVLAVPMIREGRPIGAIVVQRPEPHAFSESQIELLKIFAEQAVIAIENVRLVKELKARTADLTRSVEQLTALGEVGRAVSSTLDLETVLNTIVSRAVQLSGLDGGVVFEYDDETEEFVQRVATETGGALAEARRTTRVRRGEGPLGRTAITLEPVQVPDITVPGAHEGRLRQNLIESGIRAVLAVPMVREGHLIGCLGVTRNRPGEFGGETIDLLRTFATQSALAIQNARLFREIEQKSRELEAASRHKSEFLANMSHELRTPLNAVIGFSEVLTERMFGELNEKQEEYLKDIHASGQHLLSLINDILDLSKIEAGKMDLELSDFDLPMTIDNALMLVRERAARRGIELHKSVDERLGQIQADERKVRQVLLNLLSNAIKFTPDGGHIGVAARRVNGIVEISVTDTGVGIAPEDQEAVFEEFRQVGTAEKKVEGTGLGLALSRKFIELHGGKIWVKSQVGAGSTFTFTVPVRRGE